MIGDNEIIELIKKAEEDPVLDYKQDLPLQSDGDKAEFVKDVIALANSGEIAHIIIGVEDGTGRPVGLKTLHTAEQMNQILKDKCDPPISVEYVERSILGYKIGVIEIKGEDPPYVVSVPDKLGGSLSANPQKQFYIERGTVFIRNYNINEGAKRADLDKMYKVKYATLEPDLRISHKLSIKSLDDSVEADISFVLTNKGGVLATQPYVWIQFKNVKRIVRCTGSWVNISEYNDSVPTIRFAGAIPIYPGVRSCCQGAVVEADKGIKQVEAYVMMGAVNMRVKEGAYAIPLGEKEKDG
jgi:hypothetical protein